MVKFGKFIESHLKPEWKDYYIDYKSLKSKIKDLKHLQDKEIIIDSPSFLRKLESSLDLDILNHFHDLGLIEHLQAELENKSKSQQELIKRRFLAIGKYMNEFLTELDEQVKKFFQFYLILEKELRNDFADLKRQIDQIHKVDNIKQVLTLIENIDLMADKIINICQYININITAIRKILKKYDKKFDTKDNPVALHYLKENLSKNNSSLVYILQFKIIDEASALLDFMVDSLQKSFFRQISKSTKETPGEDLLINEPLILKEINLEELSGAEINQNIIKIIQKKFNKIKLKIEKIDDSNNLIRSGIEVWSLIIKSNMRVVDDYFKTKAAVRRSTLENIQENILEKLTPQLHKEEEFILSIQTKINLWVVLLHTFIYTMNCYIVQPTNGLYVAELGATKTLSGFIMGLTHLAAIFCTFLYSYWTNFSYKFPLLISCSLFIFGNFFYSFAEYENSLYLMGLGRFLIGFASARVVNRRYIIDQVPTQLIMFFSLLYVGLTCLGMAAGPFMALLLLQFFPDEFYIFGFRFNTMTNPGWFCLIIWIFFTFFILIAFKDPENNEENNKQMNRVNTSSSLVDSAKDVKVNNTNNINDFERDIQEIIHDQENNFSYMNVAFSILIIVLLVIRMTTETLMVLTPISTAIHFGISPKTVAWFLSFTSAIVFPLTYFINKLEKKYSERQIIFTLLLFCLFSCVMIINLPYFEVSLIRFMIFYTILFVSCNILESVDSALLAKIFPMKLNTSIFNSGFTIILSTTGGKFIGSFLVTIIGWFFAEENVYGIIIGFYLILFAILNVYVYNNFTELRVKAIARIIQKNE